MSEPGVPQQSVLMDVEPVAEGWVRAKVPVDKTFRRYDQDQPMLLALDLRDLVGVGHPARWVDELVEHGLDLSGVYADYTDAATATRERQRRSTSGYWRDDQSARSWTLNIEHARSLQAQQTASGHDLSLI